MTKATGITPAERADSTQGGQLRPSGEYGQPIQGEISPQRGCMDLTVTQVARLAREIYRDTKPAIKYKQAYRPYICPFHLLVEYIPHGASVLDVGCGAGLFILLMAKLGWIRSAVGFDADNSAIRAAQDAAAKFTNGASIQFEWHSAHDWWPKRRFDVVSIIDVMHHVPPQKQADLIAAAAEHLNDGGLLLYKDMASRPLWRAWANRVHDLVSVQEWIHYAELEYVIKWARDAGLHLHRSEAMNMLWYRHEYCIFQRGS